MPNISVLILTKNEEQDLPGCLESVAWSDDIYVLDSQSTDRTSAIALANGAKVETRAFTGYASQRNAGLNMPFKNEWILILDADERIPEALRDEMLTLITKLPTAVAACRMRRRDIWWGKWLKHAQISPFYVRLVRYGRARYEREVNEVLRADGEIVDLTSPFDHYPFSKGLEHWINKHNLYSSMEARSILEKIAPDHSIWKAFFARDFNERRVNQKQLFYRMPLRPFLKLLYMLVVRRAFLDGWPGVRYCILQTIYEYFILLKVIEQRRKNQR